MTTAATPRPTANGTEPRSEMAGQILVVQERIVEILARMGKASMPYAQLLEEARGAYRPTIARLAIQALASRKALAVDDSWNVRSVA